MSSTKLLTTPRMPHLQDRAGPWRRKPFDLHGQAAIRGLLAALRDIGDRPNIDQLLLHYEVSETQLLSFIQTIEAEAVAFGSTASHS